MERQDDAERTRYDESEIAATIGSIVIKLSLLSIPLGFFGLSRIPDPAWQLLDDTLKVALGAAVVGSGIGGALFGYLLVAVASVLRKLERLDAPSGAMPPPKST